MATYFDDNGNEITYEQWKANKEKKEAAKKEETSTAKETNTVKETDFKGDRNLAKRTWQYLKDRGNVTVDLESWIKGIDEDNSLQARTHGYLMDKGVVTVDFNEWKKGLIGETGPLFKVDGKTLDINGVEVNVANPLIKEKAEGYKGSLADINYEVSKLKNKPLLNSKGKVDIAATNKAIKDIQADAPGILQVNDKFDGDNLTEAEAKEFDDLVGPIVPFQIDKLSGDVSYDRGDSDDNQNIEEKRKQAMAKIIAARQEKLDLYNKGELELSTEDLIKITKINPEVEAYLKEKMPEFNDLETRQDLEEAYANTVNTAVADDPRFSSITTDIKNNINDLSNDKWTEIGDKYDTLSEDGFKLAQQEYTDWWNKEFQTRLGENKEAVKLFTEYGISGEKTFAEVSRDFDRQLVDSEQEDSLRPDWMPEKSLIGAGLDLWDNLFSTKTADKLYDMAGFDIDNQEESSKDFNLLQELYTGAGFILEAGDKLPESVSSNINKVQVALGKEELERRADIVSNLEKQIKDGNLNKNMTLGEARKLDESLNERLAWHDWTWTDKDNLGEYLTRKEKRENISEKSISFDLEEMAEANAKMTKFITPDTGASIVNPFGNNNLLGLMEAMSMGIDQAPHMVPSILGTTMLAASGVSLAGSGGLSAGGSVPLAAAGVSLIALGSGYQGAISYGNIYMDAVERQMEEKYGKGNFTTAEYLESLKSKAIGDQYAAAAGGASVFASEFVSDIVASQIGGAASKAFGPVTQKMLGNTVGNYLLTGKIPQVFFNMKMQAGKEFLTEGFQSYLEQGFTNLAVNPLSNAGGIVTKAAIYSAFTENIDFDQIMTEAEAGWKMGHLFGFSGSNNNLGVTFDKGNSVDSYIDFASKMVNNMSFDPSSKEFKLQDKVLQEVINGARNNKNLTPNQIRQVEIDISNMRDNAIKVPNSATIEQRTELNSLLDEKRKLIQKIKKINDKDLSVIDIERRDAVSEQIKNITKTINESETRPLLKYFDYSPDYVVAPENMQDVAKVEEALNKIDNSSFEQTNRLLADEDFDVNNSLDQRRAVKIAGGVIEAATKRLWRQGSLLTRDQFKTALENEYIKALTEYDADLDTGTGAGSSISSKFNLRAGGIAKTNLGRGESASLDSEQARQVADTTEQREFDEVQAEESKQREKVYASQTAQIANLDTAETKAIIKDEVSKDILLGTSKGINAADSSKNITNQSKKEYFKRLRKDIGTFSSQKYKDFVNSLDAEFIKSLPVATIKRRFGKLFGIKQTGTTKTKQISKTGKPSYFNKPVFSVPKVTAESLQAFKDYFLSGEKRQQSLYNILATDFALESMQELIADKDFMGKLQTALGNDGITALEFMQNIENKLDARVKEDSSLDVVDKKTRKKSTVQDLTKSNVTVKSPVKKAVNNEAVVIKEKTKPKKQLSEKTISNAFNEKGSEGINTLIDAFDPNFRKLSIKEKIAAQKAMLENLIKLGMPIKNLLKAANLSPGYAFKEMVNRGLQWISDKVILEQKVKDRPDTDIPQTFEAYLRGEIGDIKAFKLEMQKKYGETTDSDITAALQGRAIGGKGIKSRAEADVANSEAIIRGREKILNIVKRLGPSDKAAFIDFLYSNSNLNQNLGRVLSPIFGFQKIYNPIKSGINKKGKEYVTNPIINEHVIQFNNQVKMIASLLDASSKIYKDGLKYLNNNQFQVPIQGVAQEQTYTTIDGGKWPAKSKLHKRLSDAWESFLRGEIEWTQIPDGIIRYFNEYFYLNPNNVSFRNPINNKIETAAKIYNAEIKGSIKVDGKTFTAKQLMSMNPEGKAMFPNVEKLQARAVDLAASKILNPTEVQQFINANLQAAVAMNEANFVIQENIPGLFEKICNSPCRVPKTSDQIKKTLENSLDTQVNAQKINKPTKGISVFDFDDTLATTSSQVIVNMPDGTSYKIDASEFAAQSVNLENDGAKFDFSEFNKVVGGKKGPLADLALKRQNKFGSGDIFVLTARPQASAQGIKTFLDGIGLNLPIENITGLENGSPQAKADWVLDKTAQGYNDFYFADDAIKNVEAVKQILDQVDVKSKVQQAIVNKSERLNAEFKKQIEQVTGKESFKEYSTTRARLEGAKKDKGILKFIANQLTITPSAEDFMGLMYDLMGKGAEGNRHAQFILDNLMKPFNKAEQEVLSAKVSVANDFAALRDKFPSLKSKNFSNPLMESIGIGPYTKSHAVRVYIWNKQGMDIPGLSKRDQNALVKAVESNPELNAFADNVIVIQKDGQYPSPGNGWAGGNISTDILGGLDKGFRTKAMTVFNENVDIIFSQENMNKLEALFGTKWTEALKDSLRRMKAGSNRPVYQGGGSRVVNNLLDWLNGSVGAIMFLNMRSGLLQLISNVNFVNWGDNNMYAAAKAFANQPQYWKDVVYLMNSDYLVNRRDGLKINVNEAELANAAKKGGMKGALAYMLDKGFVITRIMDTLAIASGGATFYRNRTNALLKRQNPDTGKIYTLAEAEAKAFDDFYAVAEESQQSSNPSKISQQQASLAGRVILSFQNVTMQYNRKMKKAIRNLYNRRKNPGQTQRESDLGNLSQIIYYSTVQNIVFHSLQQALFAGLFKGEEEDDEERDKTAGIANGMLDSILFGLGFGGAAISTVKNVILELAKQGEKKAPKYEDAVWGVLDFSPVLDSKVRKLKSAFKSFSWNMKEMKRRGWSLENPAYLAVSQIIAAFTNVPLDRVMRKYQNISTAMDEETKTWQRVALAMGWDTWSLGLPYWGLQSTIKKEEEEDTKLKADFKADIRKLKADGYKKTMTPEKFDNVIEMKSPYGTVMYYYKIIKNK
jgi:hypothetical protein